MGVTLFEVKSNKKLLYSEQPLTQYHIMIAKGSPRKESHTMNLIKNLTLSLILSLFAGFVLADSAAPVVMQDIPEITSRFDSADLYRKKTVTLAACRTGILKPH